LDFFTSTQAAPVPISINGAAYSLPRFLLPALKQWSAIVRKQMEDNNTKGFDADAKARFLTYFQPVIDIAYLMQLAVSPEGAEYIARTSMIAGGVPVDVCNAVIAQADPLTIRDLADRLLEAEKVLANLGVENKPDPLPLTPAASGESPATGEEITPVSAPSIPEPTPTA
jgi:hypothetical protein